MEDKKCCCPCHKMGIAVALIIVGVVFLLKNLGIIDEHLTNIIWPCLLILAGLKKILTGICKCCPKSNCDKDSKPTA